MNVLGGTHASDRHHGQELQQGGGSDRDSNWSEERELAEVTDSVRLAVRFRCYEGFSAYRG
jgi:hypothetical protein